MTKIIYIAGRDHSGSTLLDMLLSTHPRICGLGEAQGLINDAPRQRHLQRAHEKQCSCGKYIHECTLWSNLSNFIEQNGDTDFSSRYSYMMNLIYKEFGNDTVISDSSKYPLPLRQIIDSLQKGTIPSVKKNDILVVHLIKDVRSYITSFKWRNDKKINLVKIIRMYYNWRSNNIQLANYLNNNNIRHMRISYESLCFNTEATLKNICRMAGLEEDQQLGNIEKSTAHIGIGNPMRNHKIKSKKIIYDNRWFYESTIQILYHLLPAIKKCNEDLTRNQTTCSLSAKLFEPTD